MFPFGAFKFRPIFRGELAVSFREGNAFPNVSDPPRNRLLDCAESPKLDSIQARHFNGDLGK